MSNTGKPVSPVVTAVVAALCLVTIGLILMLPFDSLVVDLVYQGF
jgi:hypothetical protein